ncbi:DNA-binding transcriptional regulator, GntR family [Marinospirillum celere]|uniref:DNA-binding transcriptional regulator, GntR family n=1 Tax=Marinospirillum celere TaxID=1122252 RepID=A0A1I1J9Z0_9GAMM|nr:GntR family transcriptional regulator [Marinospirillum celere]SFC45419.1 DNA-binding transcriptional regulator, GntR family [Marinospirillum celere]
MSPANFLNKNPKNNRRENLADRIYGQIKDMIFNFELLPGDFFSEADIAERFQASRTPVREALYRLRREQYVDVHFRSGWQVKPFDFQVFEELYDVRILLEEAAIDRLCAMTETPEPLQELRDFWLADASEWITDIRLSEKDREFHSQLVAAAGNREMHQIHRDISERIHIIRRLDFTKDYRIEATYEEHGAILEAIAHHRADHAKRLMAAHIAVSRDEVRKITIHMLQEARARHLDASNNDSNDLSQNS